MTSIHRTNGISRSTAICKSWLRLVLLISVVCCPTSNSLGSHGQSSEYRQPTQSAVDVARSSADVTSSDRSARDVNRSVPVLDRLTSRQRRNVKREILAVLGLDHPPRPAVRGARDIAVAQYMMSLYRTVVETSSNDITHQETTGGDQQPTQMERIQVDAADTIISFTDHSK